MQCKIWEKAQHDSKAISNQVTECNPVPLPVDRVTQEKRVFPKRYGNNTNQINCFQCGNRHPRKSCPAFRKTCDHCSKPNHFSIVCDSKCKGLPPALKPYWNVKHLISETDNLLLFDNRLMIPEKLKPEFLHFYCMKVI